MNYRDFLLQPAMVAPDSPNAELGKWQSRLAETAALDEAESQELLRDFKLEANRAIVVETEAELLEAASNLVCPLVLKTAMPGILHKSEHNGVCDVVFALPPFDVETARRRLNELKLVPLLQGIRGRPPANIDAFCIMAARFSVMVDALRDNLQEVDVNPVILAAEQ